MELINIIVADNLEKFKNVYNTYKRKVSFMSQKLNPQKDTPLHLVCKFGSEKIFNWYFPLLTDLRVNAYNKTKSTPYHYAVLGPSKNIFEIMTLDKRVNIVRWEDDKPYGQLSRQKGYPIFQLINKPELKDRVIFYFDKTNTKETTWKDWYLYTMWQNQEWGLDLVLSGPISKFDKYTIQLGLAEAISFGNMKLVKKVFDYDNDVFLIYNDYTPLTRSLNYGDRFFQIINWIDDLSRSENMDILFESVARFNYDDALPMDLELNKRNAPISDKYLERILTTGYGNEAFFDTAIHRKDYNTYIYPKIEANLEAFKRFLPKEIKDIFIF